MVFLVVFKFFAFISEVGLVSIFSKILISIFWEASPPSQFFYCGAPGITPTVYVNDNCYDVDDIVHSRHNSLGPILRT